MSANVELTGDWQVEIWFRIEKDKDGYPQSKNWEQLLARPLLERDDYFVIESVPFFLKNVSRGDVVRAKAFIDKTVLEGEGFEYDKLVKAGGHNTYRLLLRRKHPEDPKFTEDELMHKGLAVEVEGGDFFAVDVSPSVDQKGVDEYLVGEAQAGRWEMQDGCLQTISIHSHSK